MKKIISFLLLMSILLVLILPCSASSVGAASLLNEMSDFFGWVDSYYSLMESVDSIQENMGLYDALDRSGADYCAEADNATDGRYPYHYWEGSLFSPSRRNCKYCGLSYSDYKDLLHGNYDAYVSTLDSNEVSYTEKYSTTYYYQIDTVDGPYTDYSYSLTSGAGTVYDWSFSSSASFVSVSGPTISNPGAFSSSGSFSWVSHPYTSGSVLFWVKTKPFTPIADFTSTWNIMGSRFSTLTRTYSDGSVSTPSYSDFWCTVLVREDPGGGRVREWKHVSGADLSHTFKAGYTYHFEYPVVFSLSAPTSDTQTVTNRHSANFLNLYPLVYAYDGDASQVENPSTRPASLMQTINNYNIDNSITDNSTNINYYIGTVDASSNITNVYSPNLFDEETLVFTEPVSGVQYTCTGWKYYYDQRAYVLTLADNSMSYNGTDIKYLVLMYGDDAVTVAGFTYEAAPEDISYVFSDSYVYVVASGSECSLYGHTYTYEDVSAPTCTTPGERKYTCSVCGNEYAEELSPTGHNYTYEVIKEATCTTPGERRYTCTVCGTSYSETVAPVEHDWRAIGTFPPVYNDSGTLIEYGYTLYECSNCGAQYTDTDFSVDAETNSGFFAWWSEQWKIFVDTLHNWFDSVISAIGSGGGETVSPGDDPLIDEEDKEPLKENEYTGIVKLLRESYGFFSDFFTDFISGGVRNFLGMLKDQDSLIYGIFKIGDLGG